MNKHLTGVMAAALAAVVLLTAPVFADHRPGNVVVIGGAISQTGYRAEPAGRQHNGVKLYVEELNESGGLLGHKVVLKIYDGKSDKRTAIELYEKLITEDKVDLVVGPYSSVLNDAVANVMERYKQPFLTGSASNPKIWQRGRKFVFGIPRVFGPDYHKGALHAAKKIGVKRIAIIMPATPTSIVFVIGAQEWANKLGLNIVSLERYKVSRRREMQWDFRDLLQKVKASGAEAILTAGQIPDAGALVRQLRELNINVKMFAGTGPTALPKFVEKLGGLAEYVIGFSQWEPKPALGHRGIKEFAENYEKRYGVKPNYHAAGGYAAMQILVAAVKRAGSFDPGKIRDALASIAVYTIRGYYKANERGVSQSTEPLSIQIQNGKRVIVWPPHQAEARFLPMPKWEDRAKK